MTPAQVATAAQALILEAEASGVCLCPLALVSTAEGGSAVGFLGICGYPEEAMGSAPGDSGDLCFFR